MNNFNGATRVLVVAAHPDDEVLGCGGAIARLLSSGKEVHVLILGGITTSRYKSSDKEESWKLKAFKNESEKCAKSLGITSLTRRNLKDNRFDSVPLIKVIKYVEGLKKKVKPDLVLTHDFSDLNIDHRIVHQAVMTAFRPSADYRSTAIASFEVPSSTECQDQEMVSFKPNSYVNITPYISKKLKALGCYKSELKKFPHPRSLKGVEVLSKKRGMEAGLNNAEAFRIIREVW